MPDVGRLGRVAFWTILSTLALVHVYAVFTESVNWDEFALLLRAETAGRTGVLVGGGRPGLGTLVLIPFARACTNAAAALVDARLLWVVFVFGGAVALFVLLRQTLPEGPGRWLGAATGLALWTMAPAFLRFSLQVRTDQPAIFFALWGGVALLASRRRRLVAGVAGVAFALGFLFSQKAAYVGALMGVLACAQLLLRGELVVRREVVRAVLAAAGFAVTLGVYRAVLTQGPEAPTLLPVGAALDDFAYYRAFYGWSLYRLMAPTLLPQLATVPALLLLTVAALVGGARGWGRELAAAWAVAALGVAVAIFHAARMPYFYMVLGLFPAVMGALLIGPMLRRYPGARKVVGFPVVGLLLVFALGESAMISTDTVSHQVAMLDFVERNFGPDQHGFQGTGVFTCRHEADPFRVRFRQHLVAQSAPDSGSALSAHLISEFRRRPVTFLIPPGEYYPAGFQEFWQRSYVQYWESIWVPGRTVDGAAGSPQRFEPPAEGAYRWIGAGPSTPDLVVDGRSVPAGESIFLGAGEHVLELAPGGSGRLVWALAEPPRPATLPFFRPF